ncbi:enoyl-CoA hydratase/isomerase family protein [Sulfitobacter sp. F26169L]|uniref:enoyl-CoA hydratase/isomerase family protein n=1 Tax=Sulfitobacter sp. F26169L TaxID=2996015 RepID=UPI002260AF0A|nr:enoyl-CoA hydratase/isomerase family protein [Sulfitobacter sp. F26169L]MCX7568103.1 enoyl-CoA hydratase/isomerase family protein [Sulfitobacter sp. F26169L]
MSDYETITFDVKDGIATLAFNRPKYRNAISLQMREELPPVIKRVSTDSDIRTLIITGNGGSFCAGGDIKDMGSVTSVDVGRNRMRATGTLLQAVASIDKPVIAAVDGPAYGAGFGWAMLADFVLATPRAGFCASFGKLGLAPDFGLHYTLPRLVGLARAKDLIFSAREVKADEALEMGLVYRVVEADKIMDVAQDMAQAFCNASPTAIGVSKMLLDQTFGMDIRQIGEAEATNQAVCFVSDYHAEAAKRFLNKEPFKFKWPL